MSGQTQERRSHDVKIERLESHARYCEDDRKTLWTKIDEHTKSLNNRLPLWATILISALTGFIGWLVRG